MNINGVTFRNIMDYNNTNKVNNIKKSEKVVQGDRIEISSKGKTLTGYVNEGVNVDNTEKVQRIKMEIEQGKYKVNAKLTAKGMIDMMKGSKV